MDFDQFKLSLALFVILKAKLKGTYYNNNVRKCQLYIYIYIYKVNFKSGFHFIDY